MKNVLVLAAREFQEKRFVVYSALAFAILPFVIGFIPMSHGKSPREAVVVLSIILATGFTLGLSVVTGASFVGRDLSDGRMSFYFSRPLGSMSIWFGKLIAALILVIGCFGLIAVPAWLSENGWSTFLDLSFRQFAALAAASAAALFLISHVIGTFARSRSSLIVFDFAAAVICGVAIRYLIVALAAGQAIALIKSLSIALGVALAVAIVGGGAWQLERGRTDRRRNHLALSQFLWSSMAIVLILATAYVAWVTSATLAGLNGRLQATYAEGGPFAIIGGTSAGRGDYHTAFLLNTETNAATQVDSRAVWTARFARDGRSAVVPRIDSKGAELLIYKVGSNDFLDSGISMTAGDYFASDDGTRIATLVYPRVLSVYDVATKRSLVSVRLPGSKFVRGIFVSPDLVRLYIPVDTGMQIMELDVRARRLVETGHVASTAFLRFCLDPNSGRMMVQPAHSDELTLNDARSGAVIATLSSGRRLGPMRFLRDGRIAIVYPPAPTLSILSPDGVLQRNIPLERSDWTTVVGDDGDRIILSQRHPGSQTLLAVAINSGIIERRQPIFDWIRSSAGLSDPRPPIGPAREVLFVDKENRILAWSPSTGATRRITGG
jgi:hypothetical protein